MPSASRVIEHLDLHHIGVPLVRLRCNNQVMVISNRELTLVHHSHICLNLMVGILSRPQVAIVLDGIEGHLHLLSHLNKLGAMIIMDSRSRQGQIQLMAITVMGSHKLEDMDKQAHMGSRVTLSKAMDNKVTGKKAMRVRGHPSR